MSPSFMRASTIVGLMLLLLASFAELAAQYVNGDRGVQAVFALDRPERLIVTHDTADAVGLHAGDVIQLVDESFDNRMRFLRKRVGDTFAVVRPRDGRGVVLTVRPRAQPPFASWALAFVSLAMGACALAVVVRRWDAANARALAYFATLFGLAIEIGPWPWDPPVAVWLAYFLGFTLQAAALAQAIRFATLFPDPEASDARRVIRLVNRAVGPVFVLSAGGVITAGLLFLQPVATVFSTINYASAPYYVLATAVAFVLGNLRAAPEDRERVRWVSLSIAVGFSGPFVATVAEISANVAHRLVWWSDYGAFTLVALPLGIGYAIVRHRVLDIAFVVNRALAFSLVSGVVLVTFAVLEWFIGKVLVDVSHTTSASLEMALALVLGFSLRAIHKRCEAFVDDVFFRKRKESLARLLAFARDAAFITDERIVLERAVAVISQEERAGRCAIYLAAPDGTFVLAAQRDADATARIDENDAAVVRAKATRDAVDLTDVRSALDAETAYPLLVRNSLTGLLVCGAREDREKYAPDERAALHALARALATTLDSLRVVASRRILEERIRALEAPAPAMGTTTA